MSAVGSAFTDGRATRMVAALALALVVLAEVCGPPPAAASEPGVATIASESLRTGWYPGEASVTPSLLSEGELQQIFDQPVQGQIYAQPLVADGTLLVATEDNRVYGMNPQSGALDWERDFGTPWNTSDVGCSLPSPHAGVTGTPVIDAASETVYFLSKTYDSGDSGPAIWQMHALGPPLAGKGRASQSRSRAKRRTCPV
jgi:PQQ-like domain